MKPEKETNDEETTEKGDDKEEETEAEEKERESVYGLGVGGR